MEQNPDDTLTVLVETAVSRENVTRLAKSQGYSVNSEGIAGGYRLTLEPSG
jgi:hypothetical protein